jgi:WD40 repeat protein
LHTLAFSPDGTTLVSGGADRTARLWEVSSGKDKACWRGTLVATVATTSVRHLAYSPDGRTLATAHGGGGRRGNGSIQFWDTKDWKEKGYSPGHGTLWLKVAFSRDGRTLSSGGTDGSARLWPVPRTGGAVAGK